MQKKWIIAALILSVAVLGANTPAFAQEKKTSEKTLGTNSAAKRSSSKKKSLAEVAGSLKLKGSDEKPGSVTISDHNLAELSSKGTISQGGGVSAAQATAKEDEKGGSAAEATPPSLQQNYAEQVAKIKAIEAGMKDFEEQVAKQDPHFDSGPHNRSPGTRSANELTREKVTADLAAEKQKLEAIKRQAKEKGVELKEPQFTDPK